MRLLTCAIHLATKNGREDETCSVIDDDGSGGCGTRSRVGCIRGDFAEGSEHAAVHRGWIRKE